MLTLLTATGCRNAAWAICEHLMYRQDYQGRVRWVIVDDGETPQPITRPPGNFNLVIVRPEPYWQQGQNTQARNLLAGLSVIGPDERVLIIEDDDWYAPGYLSAMSRLMCVAPLVGESHARYFNVASWSGKHCGNARHASLCSTGVRDSALLKFREACARGDKFIDLWLWRNFRGPRRLVKSNQVVGIKGLPGRMGIGIGHHINDGPVTDLESWIGSDVDLYTKVSA